MCKLPSVKKWIQQSERMMYNSLVKNLIPNPLQQMPPLSIGSIISFAKNLEDELQNVLRQTEIPEEIFEIKVLFCLKRRIYYKINK